MIRSALVQLCSGDDPAANLAVTSGLIREAAGQGAKLVVTPEVTNCVSTSRSLQARVLVTEDCDPTLAALRALAAECDIWLIIGSLAIKSNGEDGRFCNRSYVIDPLGKVVAFYDKIHMFDVQISPTERYQESAAYCPGDRAVVVRTDLGAVGLSICYDVRFPRLYAELAAAGAKIITVPAAFSPVTGAAHWESLLRARAIETGAYILAPAQTGHHAISEGRPRETHGHSLVVSPWGEVICDGGKGVGVNIVDLDLANVDNARQALPTLAQTRDFKAP